MPKQRRYRSEAQIIKLIDRARELEAGNIAEICARQDEIKRLRPFPNEISTINHHKALIDELEKRIKRRGKTIVRLRAKLAEFRTLVLPGMDLDQSIAR